MRRQCSQKMMIIRMADERRFLARTLLKKLLKNTEITLENLFFEGQTIGKLDDRPWKILLKNEKAISDTHTCSS